MTEPRQSTVYDFSNLLLHPDGTRVLQKASNRRLGVAKSSVRDSRGTWIANDAGGSGHVTRYRTLRDNGKEKTRAENSGMRDEVRMNQLPEAEEGNPSLETELEALKDYRARKRRKFVHDFEYISPSLREGEREKDIDNELEELRELPPPTSDLLKCLHFMASQFYHERGQLLNSSKEYRQQRKIRRLDKLRRQSEDALEDAEDADTNEQQRSNSVPERSERPDEEETPQDQNDHEPENEDGEPEVTTAKGKRKRKRPRDAPVIDMYRTMNGSALMVLGMLVQEFIFEILQPRIPDDWEEGLVEDFDEDIDEEELLEAEPDSEVDDANPMGDDEDFDDDDDTSQSSRDAQGQHSSDSSSSDGG